MQKHKSYIAYEDYHVPAILNRDKWLTVRWGWGPDEIPPAGTVVDLVDGSRDKFGEAMVMWSVDLTIEQFVERRFDGHRKYDSPEEMCKHMNRYYAHDFTPDTVVTLICFDMDQVERNES